MKFTCLSRGRGFHFPPSHILNTCGFRILLECPLDLSALTAFSPVPINISTVNGGETSDSSENYSLDPQWETQNRQGVENSLVPSNLIHAEPWYKTIKNLHLWNASFIDIVLISSPMGMLGLPFLTRVDGFSGKIYVTEATARFGLLMMEDLVSMHMEFRQYYGSDSAFPQWLNWEELERLPSVLREIVLGQDGAELGGWLPLYSAADVHNCMQKVQTMKFAEEACFNGTLIIKAFSSGLDIGTCNWTINSHKRNIACISSSIFNNNHAMDFDFIALKDVDTILYSDFSALDDPERLEVDTNSSLPSATNNLSGLTKSDCSFSGSYQLRCSDDGMNLEELTTSLLGTNENLEETEKLAFVCSCVVDSIKAGGSVLIPINRLGITLLLLEQMLTSLDSSGLKVPMYIISSVAEEILAFTNIIPEWLCKQRQEKLFAGEPLFAHIKLVEDKKLQVFPAIHSRELLANWQEPCIVFSPHWSLRLGPSVHLLRRWCQDPNSLLILESEVDADLALLPFKPLEMKVLQCSFLSGLKLQKIEPLLRILKPKFLLFPENLSQKLSFSETNTFRLYHYSENQTLRLTCSSDNSELEIHPPLASQLCLKELEKENMKITRLKGNLIMLNGKHVLLNRTETACSSRPLIHWGVPDVERLSKKLSEMGIRASLEQRELEHAESACIFRVHEPSEALIEVRAASTAITTADEHLASVIFDAVSHILDGI